MIKPIFDRVVLKDVEKSVNKSSLFIPVQDEEGQHIAKVVAIGSGNLPNGNKTEMMVSVGDKVLYSKLSGIEYVENEEKFYIVRQNDILAILED